ncbi:MAG: type IV pilin-like G/H family protein, partial [Sphaerospermopsis kisseleviana]
MVNCIYSDWYSISDRSSFLSQAAKAQQSNAKPYISAFNRAQQAYRMENSAFAGDIETLQLGIP